MLVCKVSSTSADKDVPDKEELAPGDLGSLLFVCWQHKSDSCHVEKKCEQESARDPKLSSGKVGTIAGFNYRRSIQLQGALCMT